MINSLKSNLSRLFDPARAVQSAPAPTALPAPATSPAPQPQVYLPSPWLFPTVPNDAPFMAHSTSSASDYMHPRYQEICASINHPFRWHRKLWEWVFIIHKLQESGLVRDGSKGLVFGVGAERLPALFARMGASIVATDAPAATAEEGGWKATGQHAAAIGDIRYTDVVAGEVFDSKVSYQLCDMNNIPPELNGFDFNWSSCCFEHLGSLEAGAQFVINAVEKTLRPGGLAVHTTEFNLSSNDATVEEGETVLYRRKDIEALIQRLRDRGHEVEPFSIANGSGYWDYHVDLPPYCEQPHLKLLLMGYVCTSVGLVIRRGR